MFLYFELHQFKQMWKFYELLIFQDMERIYSGPLHAKREEEMIGRIEVETEEG